MLRCWKCGGKTKLIDSRPEFNGEGQRRVRVCEDCNERIVTHEMYDETEIGRKIAMKHIEYERMRAYQNAEENYCNGDNCLTCKYKVCKHDIVDNTRAERKAVCC